MPTEEHFKKGEFSKLIHRAKAGDSEAFGFIYKAYYTPVYRYLLIRARSASTAEDLAQTVFVKIFQNLHRFEPRDEPLRYFFSVARNTLIDFYRKKKESNFSELGDEETPFDVSDNREGLDETMHRALMIASAKRIMEEELSDEQREAIALRFFGELSNKEIAKLLGKTEGTIRQMQSRALRFLSKKMKYHE
jgi:RNA polymerase sigma-70 factor (ECF subfamily)